MLATDTLIWNEQCIYTVCVYDKLYNTCILCNYINQSLEICPSYIFCKLLFALFHEINVITSNKRYSGPYTCMVVDIIMRYLIFMVTKGIE